METEHTKSVFSVNPHYTVLDIPPCSVRRENTSMEFCANMKRFRLAKDLKQEALAERLGVSQATIQRWESGKRDPPFKNLEALARELDVTVADLFSDRERDPLPSVDDLSYMIASAMKPMKVGVSFEDYPRAVSAELHALLKQYRAAGGFDRNGDEGIDPDIDAPPLPPTRPPSPGARRSR